MADLDDPLGRDSAVSDAATRAGLLLALGGAGLLTVIGLITAVLGYSAGLWVALAGVVCSIGTALAIRNRRS
ncbi:hypothetical protein ACFWPV_16515 [Streptomyces uncialis]|uniref:hypothetical protein n=1 Tax=Streptomyces uncialis TaxID=1048205 RepID=UPI000823DADE|nr:hypothetical protein OG924_00565 [Streptomyces uncialis]SCK55466.1 hypothetical protein YW7DRAFT_05124 [Streptomyces sp. AmelKG-E11A]